MVSIDLYNKRKIIMKASSYILILVSLFSMISCGFLSVKSYAESEKTYSVQFEMNGGTLVRGRLLQHVHEGEAAVAPELERDGYVLSGWNEDFGAVTEDLIVVALWQKIESPLPSVSSESKGNSSLFQGGSSSDDALSPEEVYAKISPSVVEIITYSSSGEELALGSGFFLDEAGSVATNYHVIEGAASATIQTYDGLIYEVSSIRAYSEELDLAVLLSTAEDYPHLEFYTDELFPGQTVYALGSSKGLTGTFSTGVISNAVREYEGVRYVQTTAPISSGNSGGPLVNSQGEAVGINTMTLTTGQNLNFAISILELWNLNFEIEYSFSDLLSNINYQAPFSLLEQKDALGTVGSTVLLGIYEQDNDDTNGKEPIEWIVLRSRDGMSLLMTKYAIDAMQYNSTSAADWDQSDLKKWLNTTFVEEALYAETSFLSNVEENELVTIFDRSMHVIYSEIEGVKPCLGTPYMTSRVGVPFDEPVKWWIKTHHRLQGVPIVDIYGSSNNIMDATCGDIGIRPVICVDISAKK